MVEELKSCPFCHREAQQTLCSGLVSCAYEDCPAFLLAVFPENWNTRAQLPSQGGEAVATDAFVPGSLADLLFQLGEKGIGVSGGTHGDHWRVTPLYTHPADQVAEPDAELVELLRECRNDFAGVSMSHTLIQRIDAKLASLEAKL